ncbi:hypothetical protein E1266_01645 [Actinomadura sp. 7K534]|nr:hypothetical protein E1266_01645 [Actinomadura sp. 7K534]
MVVVAFKQGGGEIVVDESHRLFGVRSGRQWVRDLGYAQLGRLSQEIQASGGAAGVELEACQVGQGGQQRAQRLVAAWGRSFGGHRVMDPSEPGDSLASAGHRLVGAAQHGQEGRMAPQSAGQLPLVVAVDPGGRLDCRLVRRDDPGPQPIRVGPGSAIGGETHRLLEQFFSLVRAHTRASRSATINPDAGDQHNAGSELEPVLV